MSVQQQAAKAEFIPVLVDRKQLQDALIVTDSDAESFADLVAVALAEHEDRILYQEVLRTWDEYDPDYVEGHRIQTAVRRRWTHCKTVLHDHFRMDREERRAWANEFDRQDRLREYMSYRASHGGLSLDEYRAQQEQASAPTNGYAVLRAMQGIPESADTKAGSRGLFLGSSGGEGDQR